VAHQVEELFIFAVPVSSGLEWLRKEASPPSPSAAFADRDDELDWERFE